MPARERSLSSTDYTHGSCINGFTNSRASTSTRRKTGDRSDDSTVLDLGRRPAKQKKPNGLNSRMTQMLLRANTSYTADFPTSRCPRVQSNSKSSSSVVSIEAPQTPVDAIHNAVQRNRLGSDFSVIKINSSPDHYRPSFLPNDKLPSWRDTKNGTDSAEKKSQQRELPGWLFQTFSDLEPGHPLRDFVSTNNPEQPLEKVQTSGEQGGSIAYQNDDPLTEATNDGVFAFAPPAENIKDKKEEMVSGYEDTLPVDSSIYEVIHDTPLDSVPFSQPGPFVRKCVQFLTPIRSSPLSSSSSNACNDSLSSFANQANDHLADFTPFTTPGPVSRFSGFTPNNKRSRLTNETTDNANTSLVSSDSLTLADINKTIDKEFSTNLDSEVYDVTSDFILNNKCCNPFSTPGPLFYAPPPVYFNSPTEDPSSADCTEPSYDDIEIEPDREQTNTLRFASKHHTEIAMNKLRQRNTNDAENLVDSPYVDLLNDVDFMLGEDETQTAQVSTDGTVVHPIGLHFSSSFSPSLPHVDRRALSASAPNETSDTVQMRSSHISHSDNSSNIEAACRRNGALAEPCTPPPRPLPQEAEDIPVDSDGEVFIQIKEGETPSAPAPTRKIGRFRPAFAPAPGIYLSPLRDDDDTPHEKKNGGSLDTNSLTSDVKAGEVHATEGGVWNRSQISNDSIEDWDV